MESRHECGTVIPLVCGDFDPIHLPPGAVVDNASKLLSQAIAVAAGVCHSLALKSDGTLWAWGGNYYGQIGDGTTIGRTQPVQVSILSNVVAIAAGWNQSLAIKSDGTVGAWGYNGSGELGDGTHVTRFAPVPVSNLANVVAISAGLSHSLAVKSDGTVWAWGYNYFGQLGDGTTIDKSAPVQVLNLSNIRAISAPGYGYHSLALKSDGTIWAWGDNSSGQLGDGTTVAKSAPVQVSNMTQITVISAGQNSSAAVR